MKTMTPVAIISILLLTNCVVPTPVVKLWPKTVDKKEYWNMGRQFVCDEDNKVSYECAFKKLEGGKIVFDTKITNYSDTDILVAPEKFWQHVYKDDTLKLSTDQADDPEIVLLNLELEGSRAKAASKNAIATGIVSGVVTGGAMAAIATSNKDDETKAIAGNIVGNTGNLIIGSSLVAADEANIQASENYNQHMQLSNSYLRKTTLPPGYYIDGEIRFPYHEDARWYCLQLGTGNSGVVFYFRQILFYPAQYNAQ
jgi:hypothetical protein